MKDNMTRGVAAGLLMGAGALWAYGAMNRSQKQRMAKYAMKAADVVKQKATELTK